jgi:hypothetical protein
MNRDRMTAANAERFLALVLRINAGILVLALLAVFLPHEWMAAVHRRLFLDDFPSTPLIGYMTRSLSALYGFVGLVLWYASLDVRRYRPLIAFQAWVTVIFGVLMIGIDLGVGMPWPWTVGEGVAVIGLGALMGWLAERARGGEGRG